MGPYNIGGKKDSNGGLELIASEAKVFFQSIKSTITDVCPAMAVCRLRSGM